ncbi:IS66 family insertion sequence element accessory protein TnpA [Thomasclavelia sp.]
MNNQIKRVKENVTLEKWKRRIMDFNQSAMTVPQWCKVNNVGISTFYKFIQVIIIRMKKYDRSYNN